MTHETLKHQHQQAKLAAIRHFQPDYQLKTHQFIRLTEGPSSNCKLVAKILVSSAHKRCGVLRASLTVPRALEGTFTMP